MLLGYVAHDRDGRIIPLEDPSVIIGPTDGAGKLRTLGITHVKRKYDSGKNNTKTLYEVGKVFSFIGRGIHFFSAENVYGCQMKSYVFYPVVLAFYENEEGILQLSAFTPRCLTARIAAGISIRKFEKATKGILTRDEKKKDEKREKKEDKQVRKDEKKAVRDEKKNQARERRKEKREEARELREGMKEDEKIRLAKMEEDFLEQDKPGRT